MYDNPRVSLTYINLVKLNVIFQQLAIKKGPVKMKWTSVLILVILTFTEKVYVDYGTITLVSK